MNGPNSVPVSFFAAAQEWERRAKVAEKQVAAVRRVVDVDDPSDEGFHACAEQVREALGGVPE